MTEYKAEPYCIDLEEKQQQEKQKVEKLVAFLVLLASAIFLAMFII